ncbi:MAG: hypothetical protein FJX76_26460 [Armatimonadetes bacterium]|nr:hypothetical protein [Armatimonadota bacterium]MBM4196546.1 hypothetical protein [Gammaproteobacteria bacterium]
MNDIVGQVLDYMEYKNKLKTAEWEERLWQQHLRGAPTDFRHETEVRKYGELLDRLEKARAVASKLHSRRAAHVPRFAVPQATGN